MYRAAMRATTRFCARLLAVLALAGASLSAQRGGPIAQQLVFTPYHASGVYDVGETVGWTVTPGPDAADLRLQMDDSPQQRRGAQGRHAGSFPRPGHDRNPRRPARDDLRRGRSLRGPGARACAGSGRGRRASPAAIPGATPDSTPSAPRWHRPGSGCPPRVRPTSTRSGTASSPRRRRFPLTRC